MGHIAGDIISLRVSMDWQVREREDDEDMDRNVRLYFEDLKIQAVSLGDEASIPDLIGETILQNRLE